MRGKLLFLGGLAVGFVLGTRAGREKYEELVQTARKIKDSPTVQEAAGVVQEQATRLYSEGKSKVSDKLANSRFAETRLGERLNRTTAGNPADASAVDFSEPLDDSFATSGSARPTGSGL